MNNCENCYHFHMCDLQYRLEENSECKHFKDESLIVELPCKVGDKLYIVGTECLADKDSRKCEEWTAKNLCLSCEDCPLNKRKIVFERTATKHMLGVLLFEDNENFIFGKTVFLTKEEAEKKLKEYKGE